MRIILKITKMLMIETSKMTLNFKGTDSINRILETTDTMKTRILLRQTRKKSIRSHRETIHKVKIISITNEIMHKSNMIVRLTIRQLKRISTPLTAIMILRKISMMITTVIKMIIRTQLIHQTSTTNLIARSKVGLSSIRMIFKMRIITEITLIFTHKMRDRQQARFLRKIKLLKAKRCLKNRIDPKGHLLIKSKANQLQRRMLIKTIKGNHKNNLKNRSQKILIS